MEKLSDQMKKVWHTEQEILDVTAAFCEKHHLRYSLGYGTLLGAVRHGGFIPWDDDIDLMMPRADYEQFLHLWQQDPPAGYLLQNIRTDPDFTQNFSKIRKDHTTFIQEEYERQKHYQKGFFIDIFPMDRVPAGKAARTVQYLASAVNLLYSRGFTSGSGGVIGLTERLLIRLPGRVQKRLLTASEKIIRHWNGQAHLRYFTPDTIGDAKVSVTPDLFLRMIPMEFEGRTYQATAVWETFLTDQYGDYMQLPPEEERVWKHHPLLIDFKHNYEELNR